MINLPIYFIPEDMTVYTTRASSSCVTEKFIR